MTYEEVVHIAREVFENADARMIFEHIAIQVNIVGEGSGVFYIEVADRNICVEPYDYVDRDGLVTTDAQTIVALLNGKTTFEQAMKEKRFTYQGNPNKFKSFRANVILPEPK